MRGGLQEPPPGLNRVKGTFCGKDILREDFEGTDRQTYRVSKKLSIIVTSRLPAKFAGDTRKVKK